ncbi:ATP-dependent nuclease [Ralstonia insidiosa]|uniref:ATP-dependent nuclease n=1 Tax=Ralstonia insidiosa TaxID=190721 RepID=UPI000CEE8AC1|nr:AAA family ATPase [Ralstonia insidiosa]
MATHIKRLAFCGLRRLNPKKVGFYSKFKEWSRDKEWIELGEINIFIGPNGGGKTTVLDLVHSMSDPRKLVNLARENATSDTLSAFEIHLKNGKVYTGYSISNIVNDAPNAPNIENTPLGGLDIQFLDVGCIDTDGRLNNFSRNVSKVELDEDSVRAIEQKLAPLSCKVAWWQPGGESDPTLLATILNRAADHLPGVLSPSTKIPERYRLSDGEFVRKSREPFRQFDENRLGVWLSDDVGQQNHIHVEALPSGWRRLASILSWLSNIDEGTICLIEEPETHLHPVLQRHLAREIDHIAGERKLQILIATHSPVFQQMNIWRSKARVFSTESEKISDYSNARGMLDLLGIKASDVFQSNGIVWVEGPSDRLYIKHWLSLWCQNHDIPTPVENVDYSFSLYGGASLSHFSAQETGEFIEMIKINRNFVIVMDSDLDFKINNDGSLIHLRPNSAKSRIIKEIEQEISDNALALVTDGYTIENYLPHPFFDEHFSIEAQGVVRAKIGKVDAARRYAKDFTSFLDGITKIELERWIGKLAKTVLSWGL